MSHEKFAVDIAMKNAIQLGTVISKSSQIVALLADKRVTLEEKMITRYLHDLATVSSSLVSQIHTITRDGAKSELRIFTKLEPLLAEIAVVLDEMLKIIHYNLNFLEQYYEHDFYDKLVNEHNFLERLQEVETELLAEKDGSNR